MPCECVVVNREPYESQREWMKRWMCMHHWMETDYYQNKLPPDKRRNFDIEGQIQTTRKITEINSSRKP